MRIEPLLLFFAVACTGDKDDETGPSGPDLGPCVNDNPLDDSSDDLTCDWGRMPETVQSWCDSDGGTGCDPADWRVSRDAAVCIAEGQGVGAGNSSITAVLEYDLDAHRPIWFVYHQTVAGGMSASIDLVTAEVLATDTWDDSETGTCR